MDLDIGNFTPGDSVTVFSLHLPQKEAIIKFGVLICYDSVFPYVTREFVKNGAEFLVIITNDGWFGRTSGPYQHAQYAILRAIETRRWIARCANTGISEFIDPYGRIVKRSRLYEPAVLSDQIEIRSDKTAFIKYGDIYQSVILILSAGILLLSLMPFKWVFKRQSDG